MNPPVEITKHIKFPFLFDEALLVKDLNIAMEENWIEHFNKGGYDGSWNSIALYAPNGDASNIFAFSGDEIAPLIETEIMKKCAYFKEVLNSFKCPLLSVRLLCLGVGATIKPHKDHQLGYEDNCFRIHVPITTNPNVTFTLDDVNLRMQPGECWYTNVNYTHSVSNHGSSDRVHLVFDCERNSWSDNLFYSIAPPESYRAPDKKSYSPEVKKKIIEELERSKPKGYKSLIDQLKST